MTYDPRIGRQTGEYNDAGALAPRESDEEIAWRASMHSLTDDSAYGDPRLYMDHHALIEYRGFIGVLAVRGGSGDTLITTQGYQGDAPSDLQPTIDAPNPWVPGGESA